MKQASYNPAGADPITEGQRLLAKRRGPVLRWLHRHPRTVSILLAGINMLALLFNAASLRLIYTFASDDEKDYIASQVSLPLIITLLVLGAIVSTVAIFYRKRWHWQMLFIMAAADLTLVFHPTIPSLFLDGISSLILVYSLAAHTRLRTGIICLVTYLALNTVGGVYSFFHPSNLENWFTTGSTTAEAPKPLILDLTPLIVSFSFVALTYTLAFLIGRSVYRSAMFEQAMLASFEQNKQLATTEERNRIAREMHDVVAHSLTVMVALADGARIVSRKNPERAEEVLKELSSTGRTALADMRRTLGVLREPGAENAPLTPTGSGDAVENLQELVESFSTTGLPATFTHSGDAVPEDQNLSLSLYRITQEALTNALRYGQDVHRVEVHLAVTAPYIHLTIINDGSSTGDRSPSIGTGKGLVGMNERAAFYRGTVDAGPNDRGGWTVRAHLIYPDTP